MAIFGYHAHIYYDLASREAASELRSGIIAHLKPYTRVYDLIDQPIGPHPLPMFEVDIPVGHLEKVVTWLMLNHKTLSILIHPITGDDLSDHRDHPLWIGKQLDLRLEIFG